MRGRTLQLLEKGAHVGLFTSKFQIFVTFPDKTIFHDTENSPAKIPVRSVSEGIGVACKVVGGSEEAARTHACTVRTLAQQHCVATGKQLVILVSVQNLPGEEPSMKIWNDQVFPNNFLDFLVSAMVVNYEHQIHSQHETTCRLQCLWIAKFYRELKSEQEYGSRK